MEELHCIGCGSVIQSNDITKPGYVPKSKLTEGNEDIICRRCFRLKNYNEVTPLQITSDDYFNIISEIGYKKALIVMIIDIFDIEGSLIPQIPKLTNYNDLIIIANKTDLLPKSVKEPKLLHHLKKIIADNEIKPLEVLLMSATKYKNIDSIFEKIMKRAKGKDIYVVGATNVGKSTFINTLLKSYADSKKDIITVSFFAGTTLNLIKIPFGDNFIIDTPGLINDNQITHYLSPKALKVVTPKKEIKPKGFQLDSNQTLFFGGLARIDFIEGERTSFVCYTSEFINIHRTKLEKADDLYEKQVRKLLTPPFEIDNDFPLKGHSFTIKSVTKQDVVLPGLGFVTVSGNIKIKVYTRFNTTPYIREALI
ncbi:MAG: ribosome biogenesis GTPase YqeH [Candidatus Izimaplasma sp.]|nr:ribosome biogenesis GTPase YqeH [Candidatus Izimaplasma bacterium]